MSVFCAPDGRPFYGGTYFPPTARHGLPAFADLLLAIADAWRNRREELVVGSARVVEAIERQGTLGDGAGAGDLDADTLDAAFHNLQQRYDHARGGWGGAPKFPQPMAVEFALQYHHRTGDEDALRMATQTLDAMARGGMYDQLGGGFHRYSVDARWLVPHFEKMLYDNAQLARVYLHAYQVTGEPFYRTIVEETLDYVAREMAGGSTELTTGGSTELTEGLVGGFYSTQDADSEGEEGKFFVWSPDEIRDVLGDRAGQFIDAYGVTGQGNFEGRNILELTGSLDEREALSDARSHLFDAREARVRPGRDEKVLTSWNGLMLAAFAEAARVLDNDVYRQVAERNADFLLRELRRDDGRLYHTWKDGQAKVNGYLEDYAHLIDGLIELYQTTYDPRWYHAAHELAEALIAHFGASEGGFYDTSDDHEELITRPRELQDNAVPSGNAMAAWVLLRLSGLALEPRYLSLARDALIPMQALLAQYPLGFGQWLQALTYALSSPREIAVVGDPSAVDTRALLSVLRGGYRPHQVVAVGDPAGETPVVPILRHRTPVDGRATVYVCVKMVCQPPVTDREALHMLLEKP